MNLLHANSDRPSLLVSVRGADEARIALAGGAELIDVKEPSRGALGAADTAVVAEVVESVGGRAPISVAAGELLELASGATPIVAGVALVKFGLAGCGAVGNWPGRWRETVSILLPAARPVAVVYADWRRAEAPRPEQVLEVAAKVGCAALLVDTWSKSAGTLFDHWSPAGTARFCRRVQEAGLAVAVAGSISLENLERALRCRPDVIAVRGGVCDGSRSGHVQVHLVQAFRLAMDSQASVTA